MHDSSNNDRRRALRAVQKYIDDCVNITRDEARLRARIESHGLSEKHQQLVKRSHPKRSDFVGIAAYAAVILLGAAIGGVIAGLAAAAYIGFICMLVGSMVAIMVDVMYGDYAKNKLQEFEHSIDEGWGDHEVSVSFDPPKLQESMLKAAFPHYAIKQRVEHIFTAFDQEVRSLQRNLDAVYSKISTICEMGSEYTMLNALERENLMSIIQDVEAELGLNTQLQVSVS